MTAPATVWEPQFEKEDGWIVHRYDLESGNVLRYAARDVRRERTGCHAKVDISLNWVSFAWSNFNLERDEDRVRLTNSAYKHFDGDEHTLDRTEMTQNKFKHAFDLFCLGLWDEVVGENVGGWLCGDPSATPAKPLLRPYVLAEAGTIMYAPPGTGKSYTALLMAVCLQYGISRIWELLDTAVPLYINLERSERSMRARLARVNVALGLDPDDGLHFLNARGRTLSDIYESAQRTIERDGCDMVFYDSISRSGAGGSMAGDEIANRIMDMLNALCPTWVAIGHSPRGDESHVFGSQMFDAAADVAIQTKSQSSADKRSTGIGLEISKANDIPTGQMSIHVLEWDEGGLSAIRRSRQGEFAEIETGRRLGLEQEMIQLLKARGAMAGIDIADELGRNRSFVARLLTSSDSFVAVRKEGQRVLYGAKD